MVMIITIVTIKTKVIIIIRRIDAFLSRRNVVALKLQTFAVMAQEIFLHAKLSIAQ